MDHTDVSHQRWHDHWTLPVAFPEESANRRSHRAELAAPGATPCWTGCSLEPGVRVVELGPGTGAITGEIARAASAGDLLPRHRYRSGVHRARRGTMAADRRGLRSRRAAASRSLAAASCCPSTTSCPACRSRAFPATSPAPSSRRLPAALRPGGTFTTFQYIHCIPAAACGGRSSNPQQPVWSPAHVQLVLANLPPAFVDSVDDHSGDRAPRPQRAPLEEQFVQPSETFA